MPSLQKMSDEKQTVEYPAVIIAQEQAQAKKMPSRKKHVIIAVSAILTVAIILTAILVGMYMFTEAEKEIIKYSLKMGENSKQDVTSDPNENVVQYHVSNPTQDTWIVNDFNKDIQLMKIKSDGKTTCFISPLNRTDVLDPAKITGPDSGDVKNAVTLTYRASDTPVSDTSFLGKTARETCKGISIYWLYPHCSDPSADKDSNLTDVAPPKTKRQTTIDYSPYYIKSYSYYYNYYTGSYYTVPCVTGCCRKICACSIYYSAYISWGRMYCSWIAYACPPYIYYTPLLNTYAYGPRGLYC